MKSYKKFFNNYILILTPGILTAMTGVGVGDLATAGFAGNKLGVAVLWAVLVGAAMKYILSEGLTRWQLATQTTLLEGCIRHLKKPFLVFFVLYFFPWSYFVGGALISACGVTFSAMMPFKLDPWIGKLIFGALHSFLAVLLILLGGYKLFCRIMSFCAVLLFACVVYCLFHLDFSWLEVGKGLVVPRAPTLDADSLSWVVALIGGVGGTLTILCYGYWIQEEGRSGMKFLRDCRIDLFIGYFFTALFGIIMVIIGSRLNISEKGLGLIIGASEHLGQKAGWPLKYIFLLGAWGAVFSSLLGVWHCVPAIFSDCVCQLKGIKKADVVLECPAYKKYYNFYLWLIALVPLIATAFSFKDVQKMYSIVGACFIPMLACVLLYLNSKRVGVLDSKYRNRNLTIVVLWLITIFFITLGFMQIKKQFGF